MNKNLFAEVSPMGWNSYDYYDTTVNEKQVKDNAVYMADKLKKFGWEYIVADIQWYAYNAGTERSKYQYIPFGQVEMDHFGRLMPCPDRFPSSAGGKGFKPLADYVHSLGLKFGIHIMRGIPRIAAHNKMMISGTDITADQAANPGSICNWNPDMYGVYDNEGGQAYYDSIIELYAGWGVDFIKCDDICNTHAFADRPDEGLKEIVMLQKAIQKSGRPMVLSLSPGPALIQSASHYSKYANMWRISDDFWDDWKLLRKMFDFCELWQYNVSDGCYPDCDMLPIGKIGKGFNQERDTHFTKDEQITMMTLWCIFKSPLMLGAEMTQLDNWTYSLLTNHEVLELLEPGYKSGQVIKNENYAIWVSDNQDYGTYYIAFFNFCEDSIRIQVDIEELNQMSRLQLPRKRFDLKDVWENQLKQSVNGIIQAEVVPHGSILYRVHI